MSVTQSFYALVRIRIKGLSSEQISQIKNQNNIWLCQHSSKFKGLSQPFCEKNDIYILNYMALNKAFLPVILFTFCYYYCI